MPRATAILATLLLTRCSDVPPEPAEFAELCGAAAPVRLLELPPGVALRASLQIGERIYLSVGRPTDHLKTSAFTFLADTALWSTGPCGESPIQFPAEFTAVFTIPRWPELPLACRADQPGIFRLDPAGVQPPHLVFNIPCALVATPGPLGLLSEAAIDDDTSVLQLTAYPDDPQHDTAEPVVLLDAFLGYRIHVGDSGRIHALTPDRTLVRIDPPSRDIVPVLTDVAGFAVSNDERYLEWADLAGVISLRDQATGTSVALGIGSNISYRALAWADRGFVVADYLDAPRLYALPDLRVLDLPPYFSVLDTGPLGDSWPIQSLLPGDWLRAVDLRDGSTRPLFARVGTIHGSDARSVRVLDVPTTDLVQGSYRDEGPVWHLPLDGSPARKLADRATVVRGPVDPHTLLTAVDIDAGRRATLIRVDLATRGEHVIDDHVLIVSDTLAAANDPTLLTYSVDDGERSGVWMARLTP